MLLRSWLVGVVMVFVFVAGCTPVVRPAPMATPSGPEEVEASTGGDEVVEHQLAGTNWQWLRTEYGDDSVIEIADPSRYTLAFGADGSLTAQVDCNRGVGTYQIDGTGLELGALATTRMMCPPDSQDNAFLKDLDGVVSYMIVDGYLFLALIFDTGIMEFAPAP